MFTSAKLLQVFHVYNPTNGVFLLLNLWYGHTMRVVYCIYYEYALPILIIAKFTFRTDIFYTFVTVKTE